MTKKISEKAIDYIHEEMSHGVIKQITAKADPKILKELGVDTSNSKIEVRNLRLNKDLLFSSKYSIKVIDKAKDWDGKLIETNKELESRLVKIVKQGESKISFEQFADLKIHPKAMTYKIGKNIKLTQPVFGAFYNVVTLDSQKDGKGRWKKENVTTKKIKESLAKYEMTKADYNKKREPTLNNEIVDHLSKTFENVKAQSGNLRGYFDVEIGDMHYVIEIKKASALKKNSHEAAGQIRHYLKKHDNKIKPTNFMLLILGENGDLEDKKINDLIEDCKGDFSCAWDIIYAK